MFIMNFFNKKNECPKTKNNKEICHHSDYIKIQFDGGEMRKKFKMWFKFNSTLTESNMSE